MISVDTVYQKVLAILNKENRGYMTPQEYNLLANQAQYEIFEQYFYDINQHLRRGRVNHEYGDVINNIEQKINKFRVSSTMTLSSGKYPLPSDLYKIGTVTYNNRSLDEVQQSELNYILNSNLTAPTTERAIFVREGSNIAVYPSGLNDTISISYLKKPAEPNWTYTDVGGTALYNSSAADHQNFELDDSEEPKLVVLILSYAGITIKAQDVYPAAEKKYVDKITLEKS